MPTLQTYRGRCHCGAVRFRFRSEPITTAVRCNCSICIRKGTLMSARYYAPEEFEERVGLDALTVYRFGDRLVNHAFCSTCGVHPFHDATVKLGHYRVNLGCLEGFDPLYLPVELIDGKSF